MNSPLLQSALHYRLRDENRGGVRISNPPAESTVVTLQLWGCRDDHRSKSASDVSQGAASLDALVGPRSFARRIASGLDGYPLGERIWWCLQNGAHLCAPAFGGTDDSAQA